MEFRKIILGALVGGLLSITLNKIGVEFYSLELLIKVLITSLVLMKYKRRYMCTAYAGSIVALLTFIFSYIPNQGMVISESLTSDIYSLMLLVGLMHIAEGVLVFIDGATQHQSAEEMENTTGKLKCLNKVWPIFIIINVQTISVPFSVLALGVVYSAETVLDNINQKTRESSKLIIGYGVIITVLSSLILIDAIYIILVSISTMLLHEIMIKYEQKRENGRVEKILDQNSVI